MISRFLRKHLGTHAPIILIGAALGGTALGLLLSWHGAEYQRPYPLRHGEITWTYGSPLSQPAEELLDMGKRGSDKPWSAKQQSEILKCQGVDVETTFLIGVASDAVQPNGWLSLPGLPMPPVVQEARRWFNSLAQKTSRHQTGVCHTHPSWFSIQSKQLVEAMQQDNPDKTSDWQAARKSLREIAQKERFAQVVLGGGSLNSERLNSTTQLLSIAGTQLRKATRQDWGLGLYGRVALTLLPVDPHDPIAGNTKTRGERQTSPLIDITAETTPRVILHEWFHAMDLAIAPLQQSKTLYGLAWSNQRRWIFGELKNDPWKSSIEQTELEREWLWARRGQAMKERSLYWLDDGEAQAYAFEYWGATNLPPTTCTKKSPSRTKERTTGPRPTVEEAGCLNRAWESVWPMLNKQLSTS